MPRRSYLVASTSLLVVVFLLGTTFHLLERRSDYRYLTRWSSVDEQNVISGGKGGHAHAGGAPLSRTRVIATSSFVLHEDVWMTVVKDVVTVLNDAGIGRSAREYQGISMLAKM